MNRYSRLAIIIGIGLMMLAGGLCVQNTVAGYEAGEEAQQILDDAWAKAQVKLGLSESGGNGELNLKDGILNNGNESGIDETLLDSETEGTVGGTIAYTSEMERVLDDEYAGILEVPSLNLTLCVYDNWSYSLLRKSPCRFMGYSDGTPDRMVISGHNYSRHFGNLKFLEIGDQVLYMNMYGEVFQYTVTDKMVINPTDLDSLETGDWDIALTTCTLGGRQRLVIKCNVVIQ